VPNPLKLAHKDGSTLEFHFFTEDTVAFGDMGPLEPEREESFRGPSIEERANEVVQIGSQNANQRPAAGLYFHKNGTVFQNKVLEHGQIIVKLNETLRLTKKT